MIVALVLAVAVASPTGDAPTTEDRDQLQGTWAVVGAELSGKRVPDESLRRLPVTFLIKGDTITFRGARDETSTFTLDSSRNPKQIDLVATSGPNRGKTFPGIYQLEDGELTFCWHMTGAERPTEFSTRIGSSWHLYRLRREGP